jgi:hypothetical protein
LKIIFISLFFLTLLSCAKNSAEKVAAAIDVAQSLLSNGDCAGALKELSAVGNQPNNGLYLIVLASAHACSADFQEIRFLENDLVNIVTTTPTSTLKSFSVLSLSAETSTDSDAYSSLIEGINVLLSSTTPAASQTQREIIFGTRRGGEMGISALLMNIVNLGKFLRYYGNADATGVKGAGTGTNSCFMNYTDPRAQALIASSATGACTSNNDGHADLDISTTSGKRRICEGLMSFTNILDILGNIDLSAVTDLAKLEDIFTQVNTFKIAAQTAGVGTLMDMTSQVACENYLTVSSQRLDMEYLFSILFDGGLQ